MLMDDSNHLKPESVVSFPGHRWSLHRADAAETQAAPARQAQRRPRAWPASPALLDSAPCPTSSRVPWLDVWALAPDPQGPTPGAPPPVSFTSYAACYVCGDSVPFRRQGTRQTYFSERMPAVCWAQPRSAPRETEVPFPEFTSGAGG